MPPFGGFRPPHRGPHERTPFSLHCFGRHPLRGRKERRVRGPACPPSGGFRPPHRVRVSGLLFFNRFGRHPLRGRKTGREPPAPLQEGSAHHIGVRMSGLLFPLTASVDTPCGFPECCALWKSSLRDPPYPLQEGSAHQIHGTYILCVPFSYHRRAGGPP